MGADGDDIECAIPDVPSELAFVWRAWLRLNDGRGWLSGGMSVSPLPIPWRDIIQWAEHHGYDEDMTTLLDGCCKAMDQVYLSHMQAQAKAKG